MDEVRLYKAEVVSGGASFDMHILVPKGKDIIDAFKTALSDRYPHFEICSLWESTPDSESSLSLEKRFTISNIKVKCPGCEFGSCGQLPHMEHPHGCLHDPLNCDVCELENEGGEEGWERTGKGEIFCLEN